MAFVPVPDAAQFEIRYLLDNQEIENTLWFEKTGGWDGASMGSMASALATWVQSDLLVNMAQQIQFVEVYATDMSSNTGPTATAIPASTANGVVVSPQLPNNVALCVSFRTAGRGRSFRGRNYVPAVPESYVTGNTFLASYVTQMVASYNELPTIASGQGATWIVASRFSAGVPRVTGVTTPVTQALVTDAYVDSQRRRLPGRGR